MMNKKKRIILICSILGVVLLFWLFLGVVSCGLLSPFPFLAMDSFYGKVLDTETKKPIEGAVVLAVYSKEVPGVAGSSSCDADAQETLTGESGEFKIPWKLRWFALHRGFTQGRLIIFKPGYGAFPRHTRSEALGENKSWPSPEKYIVYELPELKTKEERKKNVIHTHSYMKPLFIHAINEERKNIGLRLIDISEEEIWE